MAVNTSSLYWGAQINGALYGYGNPPWDMRGVDAFESHTRKKLSILHVGLSWFNSQSWPNNYYPFVPSLFDKVRQRGIIPLVNWASWDGDIGETSLNQPQFSLSTIVRGDHDAFLTQWAIDAKNWGHPFFLRFDWEMNGDWFPWSEKVNGNQPGDYVKAWRHVHDIFTNVGVTNVTWVWCPNTTYSNAIPLSTLYPGDSYVDWLCVDGYNFGTNSRQPDGWVSFSNLYKPTYDQFLQLAPTKPIMIGEVASTEYGGNKAAWITEMLGLQLPLYFPRINAILWFNRAPAGWDWPIESSTATQNAFARGISSSLYTTNSFATLSSFPIPAVYRSPFHALFLPLLIK